MASDGSGILDMLSGISNDVQKFGAQVFDFSDRQLDALATSIKGALDSSWLPTAVQQTPAPPRLPIHASYWENMSDWVYRHRAYTAAVFAFATTGGVALYYQNLPSKRRRRARRAANGARTDVVVLAGPVGSPVTKSLMLDLDKRGYMVYVLAHTEAQEDIIRAESAGRADIRPFLVDITDPSESQVQVSRFEHLIRSGHHPFKGAEAHRLSFVGLIVVPGLDYQAGPIEAIAPEQWSEAFNAKIVATISTVQAFLPTIHRFNARLLMLTPNVVSSLKPAFHGMESTIVSALESFTTTVQREMSTVGISVSHIRLGNFDFSREGTRNHTHAHADVAGRTQAWPWSTRKLFAENFVTQSRRAESQGVFSGSSTSSIAKATSPRQLHYTVFEALTERRPKKVYRVGRGSLAYDIVGDWVPAGIVGWVLGLRRIDVELAGRAPLAMLPAAETTVRAGSPLSWETVERE